MATGDHEATKLWEAAIAQYNADTGTKLDPTGSARSVEDVIESTLATAGNFKTWRNDDGKVARFRAVMKKCLCPIDAIGGVVAGAASGAFPPAAGVFSAVTILLKTASKLSADFDTICAFFEDMNNFMQGLEILKGHVAKTPELNKCLVEILISILILCAKAQKTMARKRTVKFLAALVTGGDPELDDAVCKFKKSVDQEQRLIQTYGMIVCQDMKETVDAVKSLQVQTLDLVVGIDAKQAQVLSKQERTLSVAEDMKGKIDRLIAFHDDNPGSKYHEPPDHLTLIRDEFPPLKYIPRKYADITRSICKGTGRWFIVDEPDFQSWEDLTSAVPYLLLSGGPGAGKSFLSTIASRTLSEKYKSETRTSVAYFYFSFEEHASVESLFGELINQIAVQDPLYAAHAAKKCISLEDDTELEDIWNSFFVEEFDADGEGRAFLVLDGLDEIEDDILDDLLRLLSDIEIHKSKIHVLLSGRPEIEQRMNVLSQKVPTISITSSKNLRDIQLHIDNQYRKSRTLPPSGEVREKVAKALTENAKGMFLYVDLMIKELETKGSPKEIIEALNDLPSGLPQLYERLFARLGDSPHCGLIRELLCTVQHLYETPSIKELSALARHVTCEPDFDLFHFILTKCPSLFLLVHEFGIEIELSQLEKARRVSNPDTDDNGADSSVHSNDGSDASGASSEDSDGWSDDDSDDGEEVFDEKQRLEHLSGVTNVHLRHKSLGDYLVATDSKPSQAFYGPVTGYASLAINCLAILASPTESDLDPYLSEKEHWIEHFAGLMEEEVAPEHLVPAAKSLATLFGEQVLRKLLQDTADYIPFIRGTNSSNEDGGGSGSEDGSSSSNDGSSDSDDSDNEEKYEGYDHDIIRCSQLALKLPGSHFTDTEKKCLEQITSDLPTLGLRITRSAVDHLFSSVDTDEGETVDRLSLVKKCVKSSGLDMGIDGEGDVALERQYLERVIEHFNIPRNARTYYQCGMAIYFGHEWHDPRTDCLEMFEKSFAVATTDKEKSMSLVGQAQSLVWTGAKDANARCLALLVQAIELDDTNENAYALYNEERRKTDHRSAFQIAKQHILSATDTPETFFIIFLENGRFIHAYDEIMEVLRDMNRTRRVWLLANTVVQDFDFEATETLALAARKAGETRFLLKCYAECATGMAHVDAGWMFDHLIAAIYREELGNNKKAFAAWKSVLASRSFQHNMINGNQSQDIREILQEAVEQFTELLYELALSEGGPLATEATKLLERLAGYGGPAPSKKGKVVDIPPSIHAKYYLARLYMRSAKTKKEAKSILGKLLKLSLAVLEDDIGGNDFFGFIHLARILSTAGLHSSAQISWSLVWSRIDTSKQDELSDSDSSSWDDSDVSDISQHVLGELDEDLANWLMICSANWEGCKRHHQSRWSRPLYLCTSCCDVELCEACHDLIKAKGPKESFGYHRCSQDHTFIRGPIEGWGGVKNGIMTIGETKTEVKTWLKGLEKEWRKAKF